MKDQSPLLEVNVFAYNQAAYIERTLRSVLAQETRFPIGLRIHDDASTDETVEIIERTLEKSVIPWEIVRPESNRFSDGLDFWHEFLAGSRAPFVAVLDGDDLWLDTGKLQSQVDVLEKQQSAALCHHRVVELIGESIRQVDWPPPRFRKESVPGSQLSELNPISTSSVVLRRSLLPRRMPPGFNELKVADYAVWALASEGHAIAYIDRPMGAYRIHGASAYSSRPQRQRILEEMRTRVYIAQHIAEAEQSDWRTGILDAINFRLAETTALADERDRIADDLNAVLVSKTDLERRLAETTREIEKIHSSSSWRLTAPFRWLRSRTRRTTSTS